MRSRIAFFLMWLISALLFLYAPISTMQANYLANHEGEVYAEESKKADPQVMEQARAYTEKINAYPIVDPWADGDRRTSIEYQEYLSILNIDDQMGVLELPRFNQMIPIFHDTQTALDKGVGHVYGTNLPIGGDNTTSVLAGHTGLPSLTVFDRLHELADGDLVRVYAGGEVFHYQVTGHAVIEPTEVEKVHIKGGDNLILFTCWPYGINSHRYVVYTQRITPEVADEITVETSPVLSREMRYLLWTGIGVATCGSLFSLYLAVHARKKRRKRGKHSRPAH